MTQVIPPNLNEEIKAEIFLKTTLKLCVELISENFLRFDQNVLRMQIL
jgi:hypothetical protein